MCTFRKEFFGNGFAKRYALRGPLAKPANAKIALIYEKSEAIFASGVSKTCILRSLTSM